MVEAAEEEDDASPAATELVEAEAFFKQWHPDVYQFLSDHNLLQYVAKMRDLGFDDLMVIREYCDTVVNDVGISASDERVMRAALGLENPMDCSVPVVSSQDRPVDADPAADADSDGVRDDEQDESLGDARPTIRSSTLA